MNLWPLIIEREMLTQLEHCLGEQLFALRYVKSREAIRIIKLEVFRLSPKINHCKITLKDKDTYFILFDMRGRRYKCEWKVRDQQLINRSVIDIATS